MRKQYLLAMVAALFPLVLAEGGLRVFDALRGGSARARTAWFWGYTQDRFMSFRARPDLDIVFTGGKTHLDTNSDGFREREFDMPSTRGKRLIFCVGESGTWGTGSTSRDTTWPHRLHEELQKYDPHFLVLNAGMPGYTTVENLQLVQLRLLTYQPEAIIYMGFRNDAEFYARSLTDAVDLDYYPRPLASIPSTWFDRLWMRSSLLGLIVTRLASVISLDHQGKEIPAQGEHLTARGEQTLRDHVALLEELTARHGTKLLWVDQPIDYSRVRLPEALKEARASLHAELFAHAIPLLRANEIYPFDEVPMIDEVHFTDTGNRRLAELLAPQVWTVLQAR